MSASSATMATSEIHAEDRQLIEQLAKLQNIHDQIHELRNSLPGKLLKPTRMALERPNAVSPQQLASSLSFAAADGSRNIRKFKKDFRSEEMQDLWSKTNSADFPQGRDIWTRNYIALANTYDKDVSSGDAVKSGDTDAAASNPIIQQPVEDVEAVIKAFKETNSGINLLTSSSDEASSPFPLEVSFNNMTFQISQDQKDKTKTPQYHVDLMSSKTKSGMASQILKRFSDEATPSISTNGPNTAITNTALSSPSSSSTTNLATLLSKLASYQGWQFRSCEVCHSIFDDDLKYALVRVRKKVVTVPTAAAAATAADGKDGKDEKNSLPPPQPPQQQQVLEWATSHDGCAPL